MAADPTVDGAVTPVPEEEDARPASPRFRRVLLVVLAMITVASTTALVVRIATAGEGSVGDRVSATFTGADEAQAAREGAMNAATQFMLRLNTYGPDQLDGSGQMPDYRTSVGEVITPKYRTEFLQNVTIAEQTVAQLQVTRSAKVFAAGVRSMDLDSAEVLVAGSFTNAFPDKKGQLVPQAPQSFRVVVSAVLTNGTWLVDDFNPVTSATQEDGQ